MTKYSYPSYPTQAGYMTETIRAKYLTRAIEKQLLPAKASRMEAVLSLAASNDETKPIQFWQLYSVLGTDRIVSIVRGFYDRVYEDEPWFSSVFERIASKEHHIATQASMWVDVMGGGHYYHGGEFRLNFHHTHNAMELMNNKGAERWVTLMTHSLNDPELDLTSDPRVRPAINTFLQFFMEKYVEEFNFDAQKVFGETNKRLVIRLNLLNMTSDEIEQLTHQELMDELSARGVDTSTLTDKKSLVNKALSL